METYLSQVDWCLAKKNERYQYDRLKTKSCKDRSVKKISKSCGRRSDCISEHLIDSTPDCLRSLNEKVSYRCRRKEEKSSELINKQSELVNNYHMLHQSGFLDKRNFIFKIKECENLLPDDALNELPLSQRLVFAPLPEIIQIVIKYPNQSRSKQRIY